MKQFLKTHWRLSIVGAVIVFIALVWLASPLYGFEVHLFEPDPVQAVDAARALWQQKGSASYRLELNIGSYAIIGDYRLTFRQGNLVSVETRNPLSALATPPEPFHPLTDTTAYTLTPYLAPYPTALPDYTIEKLFDTTASVLRSMPPAPLVSFCGQDGRYYSATFDPDLGYLTELAFNDCFVGAACGYIDHCTSSIRLTNVELLADLG